MADHHSLVKRVIHALDADQDPDSLVSAYFDEDRDAVIQAAIQTLEATREDLLIAGLASLAADQ